jgi:hypothetical protein
LTLALYSNPGDTTSLSTDGTNPFTVTFDGLRGGSISKKLFVRNDSLLSYFTDISVAINDTGATSVTDGTGGYSWKLFEGDYHPSLEAWALLAPATTITLSYGLGTTTKADTSTYLPFWLRIEIPADQRVQMIDQVYFTLAATEVLLGH